MHRRVLFALAYSLVFFCIDWMSYVHPLRDLNITPWNPPAALEVLFLTWGGMAWAPWVYVTLAASDWLIRDSNIFSASVVVGNAVLVACYAGISRVLLISMKGKLRLQGRREVTQLGVVSLMGAAFTAFAYVGVQTWIGNLDWTDFFDASHRFFIGDLLGLMVVLPLAFLLLDPERRKQFLEMFRRRSFWILLIGLLACIIYVFSLPAEMQIRYFFPFFFAVGLIGAAHSLPGSTLAAAIVQVPLVWSATHAGMEPSVMIDMQIVMLTLSLTGLIIGTVVDERLRIQEKLKESLQLVAAGEMAGSLAHELHQPMNALNAYAESAMILSDSELGLGDKTNLDRLQATLRRITQETARASEIVRGLRSFFINGTSNIVPIDIYALTENCIAQLDEYAQQFNADICLVRSTTQTIVMVDPTQIRTALGNLLKNAIESASHHGTVSVEVLSNQPYRIDILISDSGRVLTDDEAEKMFKPFFSSKKDGLGLGLSISKSLIENNDGSLEYKSFPRKHLRVSLPLDK